MHKIAAMVYLFCDILNWRRGLNEANGANNRLHPLNLKFPPKSRGLDETLLCDWVKGCSISVSYIYTCIYTLQVYYEYSVFSQQLPDRYIVHTWGGEQGWPRVLVSHDCAHRICVHHVVSGTLEKWVKWSPELSPLLLDGGRFSQKPWLPVKWAVWLVDLKWWSSVRWAWFRLIPVGYLKLWFDWQLTSLNSSMCSFHRWTYQIRSSWDARCYQGWE